IGRWGGAVWRGREPHLAAQANPRLDRETLRRASWPTLVAEGSLRRLTLSRGDAARLLERTDQEPSGVFIDLWLALATPPAIGESLLGPRIYESEIRKLRAGEVLLLV